MTGENNQKKWEDRNQHRKEGQNSSERPYQHKPQRTVDYEFIGDALEMLKEARADFRRTKKHPEDVYLAPAGSVLSRKDFLSRGSKVLDMLNRMSKENLVRYHIVNLENGWNALVEAGDASILKIAPETKEEEMKLFARKSIRLSGADVEAMSKEEMPLQAFMQRVALWIEAPATAVAKNEFKTQEKTCLTLRELLQPLLESARLMNPSTEDPVLPEGAVLENHETGLAQQGRPRSLLG